VGLEEGPALVRAAGAEGGAARHARRTGKQGWPSGLAHEARCDF
jgi:hypothetical protein